MYDKIKENPISSFSATILILVFILSLSSILKINPCGTDFVSNLQSNFLHIDTLHLLSNLYGLYILTRVEEKIGSVKFFCLILCIVILNTIIETFLHKIINMPCSIGFSAILYGLFAWEITSGNKDFYPEILFGIWFDIFSEVFLTRNDITKLIFNRKPALINHFIGVISGFALGQINLI